MRKSAFVYAKTKAQINCMVGCTTDQHLSFCIKDSTLPLLPESEISSLQPSSVVEHPGLCKTWSEISKTSFHA